MVVYSVLVTTWTHSQKGGFFLGNYLTCVASHHDMETEQVMSCILPLIQLCLSILLMFIENTAVFRKKVKAFIVDNLQ